MLLLKVSFNLSYNIFNQIKNLRYICLANGIFLCDIQEVDTGADYGQQMVQILLSYN